LLTSFFLAGLLNAKPMGKNDVVTLFTDRTLYISGESIEFSAYIINDDGLASSVLYIELINPLGSKISHGKYLVVDNKTNGQISIPSDILSGYYYIKAYTRWMRNFYASEYLFLPIKIVNPYRNEVLSINKSNGNGNNLGFDFYDHMTSTLTPNISTCSLRTKSMIQINTEGLNSSLQWACLSIVPNNSLTYVKPINPKPINNNNNSTQYLPETQGFILSGKVEGLEKNEPIPFALVNISLLGNNSDFVATRTDSSGVFFIQLPHIYGTSELYIGIGKNLNARVKIDSDYCSRSINLPAISFELTDDERNTAELLIKNIEVRKVFSDPILAFDQDSCSEKSNGVAFYGTPDNIFYFDKFVTLLSVEEYFFELIPNVAVRREQGKGTFKIHGNFAELSIYNPLVLLDMISIQDINKLLEIQPALLQRIEIIPKPYYKGNVIYGGIISFFSRKGDIAGIDLPSSDMFLEFEFLTPSIAHGINPETLPLKIPDTRNTLLWIDRLQIPMSKSQTIDFYTPDIPGEYIVSLRGINVEGEVIYSSKIIVIE